MGSDTPNRERESNSLSEQRSPVQTFVRDGCMVIQEYMKITFRVCCPAPSSPQRLLLRYLNDGPNKKGWRRER